MLAQDSLRALRDGEAPPPPFQCRSVDLASPDNQCTVYIEGQRGTLSPHTSGNERILVTESLTVTLTCSTERGGFGQALLTTRSASHEIGLRWVDAHRLTVAIPQHARFSPPVEHVDNLGERIEISYVPDNANGAAVPATECLEVENAPPGQHFPGNLRQLVAPRNPEDWSAIEVPGQQCGLLRSPRDLGGPRLQPSVQFHEYARPGLPFGTRELVFVVRPPGDPTGVTAQLRPGDRTTVMLTPNGSLLRGWRATGANAERVLRTLRTGRSVLFDLLGAGTESLQMFVDPEDIAGAAEAFEGCRTRQRATGD